MGERVIRSARTRRYWMTLMIITANRPRGRRCVRGTADVWAALVAGTRGADCLPHARCDSVAVGVAMDAAAIRALYTWSFGAHPRDRHYRLVGDYSTSPKEAVQDAFAVALQAVAMREGSRIEPAPPGSLSTRPAQSLGCRGAAPGRNVPPFAADSDTIHGPIDGRSRVSPATPTAADPDERLRLIFTCCHPALMRRRRWRRPLRTPVCGLSTEGDRTCLPRRPHEPMAQRW
jgi:hypothetical protein